MIKKLMLPAAAVLAFSGQAFSEETNIRQELLENESVTALYTIDEFNSLVKTGSNAGVDKTLEAICSERDGNLKKKANTLRCEGVFTASKIGTPSEETAQVIVTADEAQPLAYRNPSVPSIDEVVAPPSGRIEGEYASIDIYQYMYALCKKSNGTPAVVVSKRFGKIARYTEVGSEEAFEYLLASGEGKDPWFFGCEGKNRFIVEKDYQSGEDGSNRFTFHPRRGLEWVDYVKADDGHVASLEAR